MHMAVEGPAITQKLNDDDKHREYILNMNSENQQRWKDEAVADAAKWDQIMSHREKVEGEERDSLRSNYLKTDTMNRRKMLEKEGEMGRGGVMMNGGQFTHHQGMSQMMVPHPMLPQGMVPMYGRMQSMQLQQPSPMVVHPATSAAGNGVDVSDSNSRKRASTTPSNEDRSKRIMMDNGSTSNRFVYPQGSITDPKFPSYTQYPMANGGPYGTMSPHYNPPACQMEATQQQQHHQLQAPSHHAALRMPGSSFPSMTPSTSTPSTVPHPSAIPSVPSSSNIPSHSNDGVNESKEDLDTLNTDNVDVMISAVETFSGEDLGGADLGLDEWSTTMRTDTRSCGTGGGPSSLPPSHSNRVVVPPCTSSAPHSNRMPTPGGMEEMGSAGGSSSTHPSPMNTLQPSPHQSYALNGLMNHVSSVGGPPDIVQSMCSVSNGMSSLPPPRTPTTTMMGPPSDSSTPFPHMVHSSSLPPHLQSSFPMSSSSHTQPSLLEGCPSLSSQSALPSSSATPKKKTKKAAVSKQSQSLPPPQPPVQPLNGMSLPFHPSINQFAPPPGGMVAPPTADMAAFGGNPQSHQAMYHQQQQHQMMWMRNQQMLMAMQQQQMRQTGMAIPTASSAGGMIPQGAHPPAQSMISPNMMMTPQQQQQMMMMHHQRQQQMRYQMHPMMDPQQAQMQYMQQQRQQMQQHNQQQIQQQQQQQQQFSGSGRGSPMIAQNGMSMSQESSPLNGSHPQMSAAYTHTSAPFPFPGGHFPSLNPSQ